jgi:hypothetical protein
MNDDRDDRPDPDALLELAAEHPAARCPAVDEMEAMPDRPVQSVRPGMDVAPRGAATPGQEWVS